jgi:uncharacterized membrane protein
MLMLAFPSQALAFTPDSDCVIDNFDSQIRLNTDSSATINETLSVNCGTLPNKHGIFRILSTKPSKANRDYEYTPIKLLGITNEAGKAYRYETILDRLNHTTTWKIGSPDVIISGLHTYKISYLIKNVVIKSDSGNALYLNLNGNFWELPTNKFTATVSLPEGITQSNTNLKLYTGTYGSEETDLAISAWAKDGKSFSVTAEELPIQVGITAWAEFPSGIVKLFQPSWFVLYGQYLWLLLLLFVIWFSLRIWKRHGQDPRSRGPVVVEYDPPKGLLPLEAGLLTTYGTISPTFVSATIIDLAVRGYLKIEEIKPTGFLAGKDWQLSLQKTDLSALKPFEDKLLNGLFSNTNSLGITTKLSDQRNSFYKEMSGIRNSAYEDIKDMFDPKGGWYQIGFIVLGMVAFFLSIPLTAVTLNFLIGTVFGLSGLILVIFGIIMPKRTQLGADTLYQLCGFQLYMRQAETYRMRFYEKEGIFEKYLPYAIVFGLTHLWTKAFAKIYEEKYHTSYIPIWYVATSGSNFSVDSFASHLSSLSSSMASTLASSPSSSGGGGGFSGGGGGGGGGGSW